MWYNIITAHLSDGAALYTGENSGLFLKEHSCSDNFITAVQKQRGETSPRSKCSFISAAVWTWPTWRTPALRSDLWLPPELWGGNICHQWPYEKRKYSEEFGQMESSVSQFGELKDQDIFLCCGRASWLRYKTAASVGKSCLVQLCISFIISKYSSLSCSPQGKHKLFPEKSVYACSPGLR